MDVREVLFPLEIWRLLKMPSFCRSENEWRCRKELEFGPGDAANSRDTKSCRDNVSCLDTMASHGHSALTPYSDDMLDSSCIQCGELLCSGQSACVNWITLYVDPWPAERGDIALSTCLFEVDMVRRICFPGRYRK